MTVVCFLLSVSLHCNRSAQALTHTDVKVQLYAWWHLMLGLQETVYVKGEEPSMMTHHLVCYDTAVNKESGLKPIGGTRYFQEAGTTLTLAGSWNKV